MFPKVGANNCFNAQQPELCPAARACPRPAANTYILFDLPGQVELFTLHPSFSELVKTLTDQWAYRLVAVHLVDAHLCTDASK